MKFSVPLDESTLKSFEEHLSFQKKRSEHTVRAYIQTLSALSELAESHESSYPDAAELIRAFIKDSAPNISKATQALRASALRTFIDWHPALRREQKSYLKRHISSPKIPKRIPRILELSDLEKTLNYIHEQSKDEQLLFYLLYACGLRISEALNLTWENIQFSTNSIHVLGKGLKQRVLPMVPHLKKLLQTMPPQSQVYVWPKPGLSDRKARAWVKKWGKELGLEESTGSWHPHKLRHSIASHLLQSGAKVPQIQKLLGHEDLATTEKYTQINPSDLLRIYKKSMPIS